MSSFFIKKLQRQEMGSPTMENGQIKFHRGRYLLISKEFISFFPHLSTTVLNDCTALPIQVNNEMMKLFMLSTSIIIQNT